MIKDYLDKVLTTAQKEFISYDSEVTQGMIRAISNAIIARTNSIGLPYWAKQNPAIVKNFTFAMDKLGLGTTTATRKYAKFEFNLGLFDPKNIENYRTSSKLDKFMLRNDIKGYPNNLVKVNGKHIETGLVRNGFAKVAKNEFQLDTNMLMEYARPIKQNIIKSIVKGIEKGQITDPFFDDKANYEKIADYAFQYYTASSSMKYNLEMNVSDQRGRSIFKALKRIGNPISSKDFRALLVVPGLHSMSSLDVKKLDDIFYFIAELCGSKADTEANKIDDGRKFYKEKHLPRLNLKLDEDRKDLHELIWLKRIYSKLDGLFKLGTTNWNIPLEIDASMSVAQIVGALTNDARLLESTNVIGTTLSDPWYIKGVRRNAGKAYGTPVFYGSSQSAMGLVSAKNMLFEQLLQAENPNASDIEIKKARERSKKELRLINKEFSTGRFAIMKQFKDALIQNYSVERPVIPIKIYKDEFNVHVNKWKTAGMETQVTESYDSKSRKYKYSFTHEAIQVPDYKRMKLFWATCLVHNLDSQIMNYIADSYDYWMLTIHDAIICLPGHASILRQAYANELKEINRNRRSILQTYRQCIGATSVRADVAFYKLDKAVIDAGDMPFNATAMK